MPPLSRAGPWGGPTQWSTSQDACACLSPASAAGGDTLCHPHTPFLGVSGVSWNTQMCMGVGSDLALGSENIQHQCCLEVGWAWDVLVPFPGAGGQSELPAATSISSISSQGPFPRPGMTLLTATLQLSPACPCCNQPAPPAPSSLPVLGRDAHLGAEHPSTGCQQVTSPCSKPGVINRAVGPPHTDGHRYGLDAHSTFPWAHMSAVEESPLQRLSSVCPLLGAV